MNGKAFIFPSIKLIFKNQAIFFKKTLRNKVTMFHEKMDLQEQNKTIM